MTEWNCIVVASCFLLLLFLVWKENKRANKARLACRLVATILAVVSLACIALPIVYRHTETIASNHEAVLLTEGFNQDSVNKFLVRRNVNIPVLTVEKNLKDAGKYNALYVADVSLLSRNYKEINIYHVFGFGLEKVELDSMEKLSIVFHPTQLPTGITSIHWTRKIKTGEKLLIQGSINNSNSAKAKIVLSSFNTPLDSATVSPGRNLTFQLATIPANADRALFSIAVITGRDTIEKEMIPVQVEQGEPLKVLMLSTSPDFESKFLKGYLSRSGYTVVARTAISRNKYLKDFLNTAAVTVDRITTSLLDKFDITIADAAELNSISKSELVAVQTQVAQRSMGLIVKADSVPASSSFYASSFPLDNVTGNKPQQLNLSLLDSTNLPAINVESIISIHNMPGTQPLIVDKQNRVFASCNLYGSGKVILTTLTNTYSWALAGYQNDHSKFWSELLNTVAVKPPADEAWEMSPSLPEINKPLSLQVQTNHAGIPQGQVGATSIYLKQNVDLPHQWAGTYWPTREGWQKGIQLNGAPFYFFVYNKNAWKNAKARERIEATEQFISGSNMTTTKGESEVRTIESEIPKVIFFLSFLLFAAVLWLENKM